MEVLQDPDKLSLRAAELFATWADASIKDRGIFKVALAGGNTPKKMYSVLTNEPFSSRIQWDKIDIFFGDERLVPLNHPDSNFHMINEILLQNIPIPKVNIHPVSIVSDKNPQEIAVNYEKDIRSVFNIAPPDIPAFDLIILGMGKDGHTASIFPHSKALMETKLLALAVEPPLNTVPGCLRITLTPPILLNAKRLMVLVSGLEKAEMLHKVLQEPNNTDELPLSIICSLGDRVTWLLDSFAARGK